ncbi:MAG: response regulator [Bryobacteraceae bacterium]
MHILLVDDDAELCGLLGEFLTREGFTVECAHDGARGLERALSPGVDLVLLDVMLPGMDGFEILRRLPRASWPPASAPSCAAMNPARPSRGASMSTASRSIPARARCFPAASRWSSPPSNSTFWKCSCAPPAGCFRATS